MEQLTYLNDLKSIAPLSVVFVGVKMVTYMFLSWCKYHPQNKALNLNPFPFWNNTTMLVSVLYVPELSLYFVGSLLWTECLCPPRLLMLKSSPPNVMVFGGGAFERWLDDKTGALMNGISALTKETPESSLASSAMWGSSEKMALHEPENGSHRTLNMLAPWY